MRERANSAKVTFRGNLKRRRHGWLRLTPAYSVELVERLVSSLPRRARVLDPFCGTGTTLLSCAEQGLSCTTIDLNPFLVWLANTKAAGYSPQDCSEASALVRQMCRASHRISKKEPWVPPISNIDRWWPKPTQSALGHAFATLTRSKRGTASIDLAKVAFCRALIGGASVSFGHQSMSFKTRQRAPRIAELLQTAALEVSEGALLPISKPQLGAMLGDARALGHALGRRRFDAVVTSPPYCNRMSYIRELRPYMYWLGHLDVPSSAGELDWRAIGGTWGIATSRLNRWEPPRAQREPAPGLERLANAIARHSDLLARYVRRYFFDMEAHLESLEAVLASGAQVYYVIGNSKFYDVVLPTEQLLAGQLERLGFVKVAIETLRRRTSKAELFEFLVSAEKP